MKKIIIAIDATSIVNTGGFTHLYHLIESFDKKFHPDINKIIVYSSKSVLDRLPNHELVTKFSHFSLNKGKLFRLYFQLFILDFFLKKNKVNILLSTTGDYTGNFRPYIGISQNMLLYEKDFWKEIGSLKEKSKGLKDARKMFLKYYLAFNTTDLTEVDGDFDAILEKYEELESKVSEVEIEQS